MALWYPRARFGQKYAMACISPVLSSYLIISVMALWAVNFGAAPVSLLEEQLYVYFVCLYGVDNVPVYELLLIHVV